MRRVSGWAAACLSSLPVAGMLYVVGRLEGDRLVAGGDGIAMAFYLSPLVFVAIDTVIILGALLGLIGLVAGPGVPRRAQSFVASVASLAIYFILPWR